MKTTQLLITLTAIVVISCSNNHSNNTNQQKYYPAVKTIIAEKCLSCHASNGTWSGRPIKLDTDQDISSQSEAIKKSVADPVSPINRRMPQEDSLTEQQIQTIVNWYQKGGQATN